MSEIRLIPPAKDLVVDSSRPFEIEVGWRVFGNLVPLWLTALSVRTENWVVTAHAESSWATP